MQGRKGNNIVGLRLGVIRTSSGDGCSRGAPTVVSFPVQTSPPESTVTAGSEMSVAKLYRDQNEGNFVLYTSLLVQSFIECFEKC